MSKEQTPITAREFIPKNDNGLYSRRQVEKHAEEYAQAKVLEHDKIQREKIAEVTKEVIQAKVLEAFESREHIDCGKDGVKTICPACKSVLWTTKQK